MPTSSRPTPATNISLRILQHASQNNYGVPGVLAYNLETIIAAVRAAEAKSSPCQILLFPWAITPYNNSSSGDGDDSNQTETKGYSPNNLLLNLASDACRSAKVPMSLHLDHAQSPDIIRFAAETGKFDSIMVDMSHYSKSENLAKTKELTECCHRFGVATEAEPGRINGGEAGVKDTGDLEGVLTSPDEAREFCDTGIDFLAPAFGNVHGPYFGVENIKLDYERVRRIREVCAAREERGDNEVLLVMHGTNEFSEEILRECVKSGMTRLNVNQLVLWPYEEFCKKKGGRIPMTEFMEEGTRLIQGRIEWLMDVIGSTGRAADFQI